MIDKLSGIKDEVIDIRRKLHQIPELGFEEFKTRDFILDFLESINIKTYQVAQTGVLGYIEGTIGKKTLAFRADIDGLSISEKNDISFASKHKGKMHACGHDGHMAIVLGLAKYLSQNKEKLKDNILLIFQPAEEGPGGAEVIVKEGILEKFKVDSIYGLHLYPEIDEGKIGIKPGPIMAQTGEFDIKITGKSGHGAIPQNSIDSIVVASNLVNGFQSIVSRSIDPIAPAVLTIGKIYGGERRNVIAGEVVLEGTIRAFEEDVYNSIKSRMIELCKGTEKSFGCEIDIIFRDMYPPVNNNEGLTNRFIDVMGDVEIINPQMIAEDFSYYQKKIPGVFFLLGVRNKEKGFVYSLHNSKFNFDERILLKGIEIYVKLLIHNDSMDS